MVNRDVLLREFEKLLRREFQLLKGKARGYASSEDAFFNFTSIAKDMSMSVDRVFLFFIIHKTKRLLKLITVEGIDKETERSIQESVEDTLMDLANYANLWIVYRRLEGKNAGASSPSDKR